MRLSFLSMLLRLMMRSLSISLGFISMLSIPLGLLSLVSIFVSFLSLISILLGSLSLFLSLHVLNLIFLDYAISIHDRLALVLFRILWEHGHTGISRRLCWLEQLSDGFFRDMLLFRAVVLVKVVGRMREAKQGCRRWNKFWIFEVFGLEESAGRCEICGKKGENWWFHGKNRFI